MSNLVPEGSGVIRRYLLAELQASGLIEQEEGLFVYRGSRFDYLIDVSTLPMARDKPVRLKEPTEDNTYPPYDR